MEAERHQSDGNRSLFGFDPAECLLGAWLQPGNDAAIVLMKRIGGRLEKEIVPFYPFFHITDRSLLSTWTRKHWIKDLEGPGEYRAICAFSSWSDMWDAITSVARQFQIRSGERFSLASQVPVLMKMDPACQYFLQSGRTSFKGMHYPELHRLQVTFAFHATHGYCNPERESDRILAAGLSDGKGWEKILLSRKGNEEQLLRHCIEIIAERDPDLIEGYGLHAFELPYFLKRCELHGLEPMLGRDGTPVTSRPLRGVENEENLVHETFGRHLIDTAWLIAHEEQSHSDPLLPRLAIAARRLGLTIPSDSHVPLQEMSRYFDQDPETLRTHLRITLAEIRTVASHYTGTLFHQAGMVPLNLGTLFHSGSAEKIELLMIREYIRRRQALPMPEPALQTKGAYTDIFFTGIFSPVLHIDIESMYPSIMIRNICAPGRDMLGIFLQLLEGLTEQRIGIKHAMMAEEDGARRIELDASQNALKILINSFYGYLAYQRALFNDAAVADEVVSEGQRIIKSLVESARNAGCIPIEVDTDGIYLVPPITGDDPRRARELTEEIAATLPEGIRLALSGTYRKMLSYKIKNYALLDNEERLLVRGSALSARSMEKFVRHYLESCIECLLREDVASLHALYRDLIFDFQRHQMHVRDFMKVETLRLSLEEYQNEVARKEGPRRSHSAAHEALLRAGREARVGERVAFYFSGTDPYRKPHEMAKLAEEWNSTQPDENTAYYIRRIDEISERFRLFFTESDYRSIFSADDGLFSFDPADIRILSRPVEAADRQRMKIEWDSGFALETDD